MLLFRAIVSVIGSLKLAKFIFSPSSIEYPVATRSFGAIGIFAQIDYLEEKYDGKIYHLSSPSIEILTLIEIIKKHIQDNHIEINQESYEIIKRIFQDSIDEALKNHDVLEKDMLLIRKVFNQF